MKNFSSKKINIAKYLNIKNDSISNIILKLKPENSRIYHFEKIENDNIKNKRDYLSPDIRKIHKIKVQKRILNDVNYVFSKSQNSINNEKFMNTKKYFSTKNINKNFFPTQIKASKIINFQRENIINKNYVKNNFTDDIKKNKFLPKIKSSQFIILKGQKNQSCPIKQIYKLKKEKKINKLDLTMLVPFLDKDDLENKINEYIIMEKMTNKKKAIFKA